MAPAELESILAGHGAVADVAVIGVPAGDDGEVPRAYIVLKRGEPTNSDRLVAFVDERVAPYKRLRGGVQFLDEIPRTATGKILRRQLRQQSSKLWCMGHGDGEKLVCVFDRLEDWLIIISDYVNVT